MTTHNKNRFEPFPTPGDGRPPPGRLAGITLIELLVALAIVGILAQLAYPSYTNYVVRSSRSAVQQFMLDLANREEQLLLNSRAYGTLDQLNATTPDSVSKYYDITVTPDNSATPPTYTITAVPKTGTSQYKDGNLTLDSFGTKSPTAKW